MNPPAAYSWHGDNLRLRLWIQASAGKSEFAGFHDGRIKLKIKAPPVDGRANRELARFLNKNFGVKQNAVHVLQGHGSRRKTVEIQQPQKRPNWLPPRPAPADGDSPGTPAGGL